MPRNRWETIINGATLAEGATTYTVDNLDSTRGALWVTCSNEGGAAKLVVEYRRLDGLGNASSWQTLTAPTGIVAAATHLYDLYAHAGVGRRMEFRFTVSGTSTPTWDVDAVLEFMAN